jgi:hypothetical protein
VATLGEMTQPVPVERHQRGLGTGEERGQQEQETQGGEQGAERDFVQGFKVSAQRIVSRLF